jgi:NAD(P)-dependent dehydrogenase (short-subunit alcohol dehydrogenase family)
MITGVGPGLGAALARRFSYEGYRVGLVARSSEFISELANDLSNEGEPALGVSADVGSPSDVTDATAQIRHKLGPISVLIHNAGGGGGDGLSGTTPAQFERAWRVGALGGFACAQATAPEMIAAGEGAMLFTGATSSIRGGGWLSFSSAKFALRGLTQSLARELWPKGIHVAHVVIDGIIGQSRNSAAGPDNPSEPLMDPDRLADAYWALATQDRSAWTLELDLRPYDEEFFV